MAEDFDFNGKLSLLCQQAMKATKGDREGQAEIIERLVNATAFTIARCCDGQSKPMALLLAGAEQRLYEAAAEHAPIVKMIADLR